MDINVIYSICYSLEHLEAYKLYFCFLQSKLAMCQTNIDMVMITLIVKEFMQAQMDLFSNVVTNLLKAPSELTWE
jgi:hypothetical protein